VRRFLRELTDFEKAKEGQREIDKLARESGKPDIDDDQVAVAKQICDDTLRSVLDKPDDLPSTPRLADGNVYDLVKEHVRQLVPDINRAVPSLAFGASELVETRAATGDKPAEKTRKLTAGRFRGIFESYLLAKTGLDLKIVLKENTVTKVEISNFLLVMVGGGSRLWDLAMTNAGVAAAEFDTLRPLLRAELRTLGTKTIYVGPDEKGSTTIIPVWESGKFAFNSRFIAYVKAMAALSATKDRPSDLPKARHYIDYKDTTLKQLGVRIGRYGDKNQKASDRESHHTTQFLLIEYFRNKSDGENQPFPTKLKASFAGLGVQYSGAQSVRLKPTTRPAIEFAKLDTGSRGEAMPAILLARSTHRGANLHIEGAAPEDYGDSGGAVTQGNALNNEYLRQLAAQDKRLRDAVQSRNDADFQAYVVDKSVPVVSSQVYTAVQGTYGKMHEKMLNALERGLRDKELEYYDGIVSANHVKEKGTPGEHLDPEYELTPDQMETVHKAAEENNDKLMRDAGWLEPGAAP
jgi:hypothetical protein